MLLLGPLVPAVGQAQQRCGPASAPDPLPMVMAVVDSAALARATADGPVAPATFSLWYDSTGHLTHVLALDDSLVVREQRAADSAAIMRARLAVTLSGVAFPLDPGRDVALRLTVSRAGDGVSLEVARSVVCWASILNGYPPREHRMLTQEDAREMERAGTAEAWVTIDGTGQVRDVQFTRTSGSRVMDDMLRDELTSRRYEPKRVDGFPREMRMKITTGPVSRRP